jgi:hypothetical protein
MPPKEPEEALMVTGVLLDYLRAFGISENEIEKCTLDTQLVFDLGLISGTTFLDIMHLLHSDFGVDISEFDWTRHSPPEFHRDTFLFDDRKFWNWIWPGSVEKRFAKYEPVTLRMIEQALVTKKWTY